MFWIQLQGHITRDLTTSRILTLTGILINMEESSDLDHTTGLYSHNAGKTYFDELLQKKMKIKCGMHLLGIDDFSTVNTLNDHGYGDSILRTFVNEILSALPKTSKMYRYDGDQFNFS